MNEIQKVLRDTEKDYFSDSPSATSETLRLSALRQIEREIIKLEKRKERLELGLDDFMLY